MPSQRRVTLDGAAAHAAARDIARRMAVVPQETHLAFEYSVLEVVLMGRYPHLGPFAIEGAGDIAIAREALAATGTLDLEQRPFSTLSGGEKQRVVSPRRSRRSRRRPRGAALGMPCCSTSRRPRST